MSILADIMSSILGGQKTPPPQSVAGFEGATRSGASAAPERARPAAPPAPPAGAEVDIAPVLDELAQKAGQRLDWRTSIVDLMKLLKMDSGLAARRKLAQELHYTGDTKDSAAMNIWLHRQVMLKLAENGGKVPAELKH